MKTALPTILVLLGACDRAANDAHAAPAQPSSVVQGSTTPPAAASLSFMLAGPASAGGRYVCPMHPEVVSDQPGLCPKCNMKLELHPKTAEVRPVEAPGRP